MDAIATTRPELTSSLQHLVGRAVPGGGFSDRPGGEYRPDATSWAILALQRSGSGGDLLEPARSRLARDQGQDGRIVISPDHQEAFWPTPLAILAWQESPQHREVKARAVHFLLRTTGRHWQKGPNDPLGHNTSLKGWPWIDETHSWIEPTALSVIALGACGYADHARVREAVQLVMDRQLTHGGWNYGNTTVFGQELHPAPESTGAALHALASRVHREQVQRSLDYLSSQIGQLHTPIALGWGLLGLASWELRPDNAQTLIIQSLDRQKRYGTYDTSSLCMLLLPLLVPGGLASVSRDAYKTTSNGE